MRHPRRPGTLGLRPGRAVGPWGRSSGRARLPLPLPRDRQQDTARPTARTGALLPDIPLPPAPSLWGDFPTKGRRERCAFGLEISCWKTKGFCGAETSGRGFNAPPPFFSKRNHPNFRQNSADIFAVLRISFLNKYGNRHHRVFLFFYEGENLIFRDFVGGVNRPHLPVAGRRGAGSLRRRPGASVAVPRPVTGPLRNLICPFRN